MSEKGISTVALIVSVLSLVLSAYLGLREFKEKAEIVVNNAEVVSADLEGDGYIDFSVDIIAANISKPTISFIKASAYVGRDECELQTSPELPISLIQGYAEKISIRFRYQLSPEQVSDLISGEELPEALGTRSMSIRLQSATKRMYFGTGIQLKSIRWELSDWY